MCNALTKKGNVCKNSGKYNGYCHLHKQVSFSSSVEVSAFTPTPASTSMHLTPIAVSSYIYFGSGMKKPYSSLSNLHYMDKCEILYKGHVYLTVEHIYQSRKFIEKDWVRFTVNGDLSSYDAMSTYGMIFYGMSNCQSKIDYWSDRKCVGIVAKLASNPKFASKLGLTFNGQHESVLLFDRILPLKYSYPYYRDTLLSTGDTHLVEFSRLAKHLHDKGISDKWAGIVVDGFLYGSNTMGNMLIAIRQQIKSYAHL